MFPLFIKNGLISQNQSGFKLGDYCVNHLLPITHGTYKSFDDRFHITSVFLDISKAFEEHEEHVRLVFSKINRNMGLLCQLQCLIPRSALLTIYKTFFRPHLDYGDIIYEKAYDSFFHQKIESV